MGSSSGGRQPFLGGFTFMKAFSDEETSTNSSISASFCLRIHSVSTSSSESTNRLWRTGGGGGRSG